MKTVFVSATGNYLQGDLTKQVFRDLVESYDPTGVYEAGAFVAHTTKWAEAGVAEPPRLAAIKSISDSFVDHSGRVYLSSDIDPTSDYEEAQQYFPHKSIEFWDATDPRNPLNQPHIPEEKRGKPYFRGFALLGDSPAAKLPAAINKFFGPLTDDKRTELSQYCDAAAGLYLYSDSTRTKTASSMKNIAKACGLDEGATEEQIVSKIAEMKGSKTAKQYEDEIAGLTAKVQELEASKSPEVREYSDKITALETKISELRKERHDLVVSGMIKDAQAKNLTVGAEKLERLKTFADRDYKDGDDKYTLATAYLEDIPAVQQAPASKVPGDAASDLAKVKCFADLAKDADLRNRFAEAEPAKYAQLVADPTMKLD